MAFRKLQKPARSGGSPLPQITIGATGSNRQSFLALNAAARKALGHPAAVYLEWDPDEYLLRIVASSPEDPAAYTLTKSTGRISVTGIMRELGIDTRTTRTVPVKPQGRVAVIADLSELPAAGAVRPIRGTAA
ncbi:hypothetical protein [Brachybacterium subflavum]|uniref:hypothetical protein n=1 Tax=Brachybacterium subflavum TaxID=2585206 RepID=UPI0012661727|nr:hypothetical protein [Brachybacterium subflavum]